MNRLSVYVLFSLVSACVDTSAPEGPPRPPDAVDVTMEFCLEDLITVFAYKNDGYDWITVGAPLLLHQRVTFPATPKLTVAMGSGFAFDALAFSDLKIMNLTAQEADSFGCFDAPAAPGPNRMSGVVKRVSENDAVRISMGWGRALLFSDTSSYTLTGLPGAMDLVALLSPLSFGASNLVIVRHDVNVTNFGTLALLDFTSEEAKPLVQSTLTFEDLASDAHLFSTVTYRSARGTTMFLGSFFGSPVASVQSVNAEQLAADDLHAVDVWSSEPGGDSRRVILFQHALADQTVSPAAPLTQATLDTVATSPVFRPRVRFASQPDYPTLAQATFEHLEASVSRTLSVLTTAAFLGGPPETWDLTVPDLSESGLPGDWMLQPETPLWWSVSAWNARPALYFGRGVPADGETMRSASRSVAALGAAAR